MGWWGYEGLGVGRQCGAAPSRAQLGCRGLCAQTRQGTDCGVLGYEGLGWGLGCGVQSLGRSGGMGV